MDQALLQWIGTQVGATGIAVLALWLLDRAHKDRLRDNDEAIKTGREDRKELIAVISENAKTFTALQGAIENLMRELVSNRRNAGGASD